MSRPLALGSAMLLFMPFIAHCSSPSSPERNAPDGDASSATYARGVSADDTPAAHREVAEVARLDSAEVQAFLADDPATLARLWSDDFVVTNPFNQFVSKQQVLMLVTSGVLAFDTYERHIEYARAYGDVVIVAGSERVVWAGRIPLAGQVSRLRYTAVWARHGNVWQEVARHANLVVPAVPGGPALIVGSP